MRASLWVVVVALSVVVGCKKDKAKPGASSSPQAPVSTADQDALWALAPAGSEVGLVASPRAFAHFEGGMLAVRKLFATAPELAPIAAEMDAGLQKAFGTTNLSAAELGLTTQKGFAVFKTEEGAVTILPVVDRDKFLKLAKGTKGTDSDTIEDAVCKTVQGVYACAKPGSMLDKLGKKGMPDAMKLLGARGDIEVAGTFPAATPVPFAVAAQVDRGALTLRVAVKGIPAIVATRITKASKPRVERDKTTGFAVMDVSAALAGLPPIPLVPGLTADELARTVSGPVTMSIAAGQLMFDLRIPISDPAPAKKLVDQCDAIPPLKMLGATVKDGACHVAVPQLQMELDAWIENKELRIGKKGAAAPAVSVPLSAAGAELAGGEWAFAFFGRGTLLALSQLPPIPLPSMPPEALMGLRMFAMINELGMGMRMDGDTLRAVATIRTVWSNPDDVVAKIIAVPPEQIFEGKTAAAGKAIADGAKGTPFSADHAAGWSGLMIPAAAAGMLAAVAIPAYMDYMKKSKRTEASIQLNRLDKNLKVAYATTSELPKGKVGPSPATPCCQSGGKCNDAAAWSDPVWQALDFSMDEPHLYRYAYESDGKTATVRAIADLDCDGTEVTYTLIATSDGQGNITTVLQEPPPNSD